MLTKEAIQFIEDLKQNNNTEWMHANKKRYESFKFDYHQFIDSILKQMKPLDDTLETLEIKNCTFRINRDIRFSKEKAPYKTNIGVWLSTNKNRKNSPGYYIHYEKDASFIAGGCWCPDVPELKKIRQEIAFFNTDLQEILNNSTFIAEFNTLSREENNVLKKAPKDYDANHPAIEFLKLKSFTTSQKIADNLFTNNNFAQNIAQKLIVLKPLNHFLNRALETEE